MDKVLQEYEDLVYAEDSVYPNSHYCGIKSVYKRNNEYCDFAFNVRIFTKWKTYSTIYTYSVGKYSPRVASLPKGYFYTELISELPYKGTDIVFWIWILKHYLEIKELRLKIIYWVMING